MYSGAVVDPDGHGLAAPFYDLVQGAHDPFGGQREDDFDAQALEVDNPSPRAVFE